MISAWKGWRRRIKWNVELKINMTCWWTGWSKNQILIRTLHGRLHFVTFYWVSGTNASAEREQPWPRRGREAFKIFDNCFNISKDYKNNQPRNTPNLKQSHFFTPNRNKIVIFIIFLVFCWYMLWLFGMIVLVYYYNCSEIDHPEVWELARTENFAKLHTFIYK